ncbi:hypothetical protein TSTA_059820 [Talaromyces stipitatus ATCC 10500]|uniref:Fucose-specific lectin n=1 Tax=Talaromyces stipitatus (strain ATCC 10500 / CBS 375.48 / QM 6759 / NRRL 1006) TaxID=441959 RepID=B8LTB0_TALSN|nr:uncharacterized protein TSTA_059820 [Talaromyces stipitatus ATCC 10500]EED22484.1 hypothetical protein TSTA_059820 [Talaromyces stipitatus ATCC 10500]
MSQWTSITIGPATETEIAPCSQLAIARPDKDDQLLRLFYQQKCDAGSKDGGPLREIRYDANDQVWTIQDNAIIDDAIEDTRLSAVSDKLKQDVRLYYQGTDMQLREIAPISAVCWRSGQSKLQIRVFTVLATKEKTISQMSYNHPDWKTLSSPAVRFQEGSGVGSCRDTANSNADNAPICVFYQPGSRVIELTAVSADDSTTSKQLASDIPHPVGIPTSLSGPYTSSEESREHSIDKSAETSGPSSTGDPAMAAKIERLEQEVQKLYVSLATAESDVDHLQARINNIEKEKSAVNDENLSLHKETELLRSEIQTLKEQNTDGAHWKSMYESLRSSSREELGKLASLTPLHSTDISKIYETMKTYRTLAMDGWALKAYTYRRGRGSETYHYFLRNESDWPEIKNQYIALFGDDQTDWPQWFRG